MPFFTHSGHQLFYREKGAGPLVLILPGNTATSACHAGELEHFGARCHAVALDFWGTGQSDRLAHWPADWWQQGAHDAAALIGHLGYRQALVVGTSGGAIVALLMAISHPEQVRAVIADSTVAHFPPGALSHEIENRSQRTPDQIAFWRGAQGEDWSQMVNADSDFLLRFEKTGGDCFHGRLPEIRCPVLVSASLEDELLPDGAAQARAMAAQIKTSRLYLAPQGGHPLMWSRAGEFRREADDFLANIAGGTKEG